MVQKQVKKTLKQKKKKRTKEQRAFKKISISDFDRNLSTVALEKKARFENWAQASNFTIIIITVAKFKATQRKFFKF